MKSQNMICNIPAVEVERRQWKQSGMEKEAYLVSMFTILPVKTW